MRREHLRGIFGVNSVRSTQKATVNLADEILFQAQHRWCGSRIRIGGSALAGLSSSFGSDIMSEDVSDRRF